MPIARRIPISFDVCTTDTTSTLAMPSATVIPTKMRISVLARICAAIAVKNCALVRIQLSTCRSWVARIDCAIVSAANGSRTLTSRLVAPPGRSSRLCAVRSAT